MPREWAEGQKVIVHTLWAVKAQKGYSWVMWRLRFERQNLGCGTQTEALKQEGTGCYGLEQGMGIQQGVIWNHVSLHQCRVPHKEVWPWDCWQQSGLLNTSANDQTHAPVQFLFPNTTDESCSWENLFLWRLLPCKNNKSYQLLLTCLDEAGDANFVAEVSHEFQNSLIPEDFITHISTKEKTAFKVWYRNSKPRPKG